MRDALMAIDAGFASFSLPLERVLSAGAQLLLIKVHVLELVTVSALLGIRCLHICPNAFGQVEAPCLKFFARINSTHQKVRDFMRRRLDFARYFVKPLFWYMAIRTNGSYTSAVGIVNGLLVLSIDVVFHNVARDTESLGIGVVQDRVESRPKNDAEQEQQISPNRDADQQATFGPLPQRSPTTFALR